VLGRETRARLDEAGVPIGNRDRETGAHERTLARADLDTVASGEIEPGVSRIRLDRDDRVVAQALDEELRHRRVP
jgi:hypothetical protein